MADEVTVTKSNFDAEVIKRKLVHGYASGHGEWYGVWGTSGAT